jgi:hypothetical protein
MLKSDLGTQILVRGGWSTSYTVTSTNLDLLIDRAHQFCAGYKKWPFTEGRVSTTFASLVTTEDGYLVGEYPEGWKSDSIRLLKIGGYEVDKTSFYKFTKFLENYPQGNDRMFSDYARRYYVNPRIDLSGTVSVWGQYTPAALDSENTVFQGETEGDEAIIEMAMSYIYERLGDTNNSLNHEKTSRQTLEELWKRIEAEQYAYQTPPDDGMFKRFSVLDGGFQDDINENQF